MKLFNLLPANGCHRVLREVPHRMAATSGWDSTEFGVELLDTLEVGGTMLDEDGDTWERVE